MTAFWIVAGLMIVVGLALLLPPLLRRPRDGAIERDELNVTLFKDRMQELEAELANGALSQEQYEAACVELKRDLVVNAPEEGNGTRQSRGGRWAALLIAVLVPLIAIGMYQRLGTPDMALNSAALAARHQQNAEQMAGAMNAVIEKLQARLQAQPDDVEGWILLGRSLVTVKRYGAAAEALANAYTLAADRADVMAEYAEVLAISRNGDFSGQPLELVNKALAINPDLDQALWLAGVAALQQNQFEKAIGHWEHLVDVLPPDSEAVDIVRGNIEQARQRWTQAKSASSGGGMIQARIAIAPALAKQLGVNDRVFVFARAPDGAPMPIAIVEGRGGDLPMAVTLNDESAVAMGTGRLLSDFKQVTLIARVSKSGNATPQPGDLEGSAKAAVGSGEVVEITIDRIVP